jgi:hypothetical protein
LISEYPVIRVKPSKLKKSEWNPNKS